MVAIDLQARMLVSAPDWCGGHPVRILNAHVTAGGVGVRYQDVWAHEPARLVTVAPGFELVLVDGGCQAGRTR
ncbi:hypothetical protein [Streptosporangium roseum]|uniref:hypothetical protein n=1 Tax=Streptosporangium roseum TaxID=2001 RepID=UPI0004CDBA70|nr:hypothetical protein [Streptosporangium roseum]